MGHEIDPEDPPWEGCPGCCVNLPGVLNAKVFWAPEGTFVGQIAQVVGFPCDFFGVLSNNGLTGQLLITFCGGGTPMTTWAWMDSVFNWHYGTVLNNNCYPKISSIGDDNVKLSTWP